MTKPGASGDRDGAGRRRRERLVGGALLVLGGFVALAHLVVAPLALLTGRRRPPRRR